MDGHSGSQEYTDCGPEPQDYSAVFLLYWFVVIDYLDADWQALCRFSQIAILVISNHEWTRIDTNGF
jgi:hypothetical protein